MIHIGDALTILRTMPDHSVQCCITSPPYWGLRDYGVEGQLGLEADYREYVGRLVNIFAELWRVLRPDGTLWLNLGDTYFTGAGSYRNPGSDVAIIHRGKQQFTKDYPKQQPNRMFVAGLKPKNLVGIPWRVAFALQDAGWILRDDIIWHKPNCMPSSVSDRTTKSHEYIFLLTKQAKYYFNAEAISEPCIESNASRPRMGQGNQTQYKQKRQPMRVPTGWDTEKGSHGTIHKRGRSRTKISETAISERRNKRSVWSIPTQPFPQAHFATFPQRLVEPCVLAGCYPGGVVLDPFAGAGTVGLVCKKLGREFIGIELSAEYAELARKRIKRGAS